MASQAKAQTAALTVNLFDGTRQPVSGSVRPLVTLIDGRGQQVFRDFLNSGSIRFSLPFHDNFADNYSVVAFVDGHEQTGFVPVKVSAGIEQHIDIMLLRKEGSFDFRNALWKALKKSFPKLTGILANGSASEDAAAARYTQVLESRPKALASLLNLTTVMRQIFLPIGTPLDYLKQVIWDSTLAQDRFFGWADGRLVDQVKRAAKAGEFSEEASPGLLHPGATSSYKQVQFGEANVQLTFHENDRQQIEGVDCVKLEPDIDYFKDPLAHALLEVVFNGISGSLTEARQVYVLRWMAGRHAGVPEFNPPYTIH